MAEAEDALVVAHLLYTILHIPFETPCYALIANVLKNSKSKDASFWIANNFALDFL